MQTTRFIKNIMVWPRRVLTFAFAVFLVLALSPRLPVSGQQLPQETTPAAAEGPEQLQQLVAPIALYPDALVAQILGASTYPTEVVQADRWLQQHSHLQGEQLAAAVDQQSWDPSVKALTAFPSVLANLDKNLSWTEALGAAYFNQQQDVLDAVQVMRQRAEAAGNLGTTPQERVVNEGPTIVIEPAYPDVCYVPLYDPWVVYGAPFAPYPGYFYDGWYGPPFISFGPAIGLGFFGGFHWGWPAWGFNWGRRVVVFNHNTYVSRSPFFFHREPFIGARGIVPRTQSVPSSRFGNGGTNRGAVGPRTNLIPRPGALSGARAGAIGRGPAPAAGRASFGRNGQPSFGSGGARTGPIGRGPISSGAPGAGRASFGSGGRPNFGGGSRGGGSRGGGSRGGGGRRH